MLPVKKSEMRLIVTSDNETYLSKYNDEPLKKGVVNVQFQRMKNAFGNKIQLGFFDELSDALRRNKFTNDQLIEATNEIVDNEEFPSVAKILRYDKRIRLLTHDEFLKETKQETPEARKLFVAIDVDGKMFYIHSSQARNLNFKYKKWEDKSGTNKTNITGEYKDGKPVPGKHFNVLEYYDQLVADELKQKQ